MNDTMNACKKRDEYSTRRFFLHGNQRLYVHLAKKNKSAPHGNKILSDFLGRWENTLRERTTSCLMAAGLVHDCSKSLLICGAKLAERNKVSVAKRRTPASSG